MRDRLTDRQLALVTVTGTVLTVGSFAYLRGIPQSLLVLGIILLAVAWCCVKADTE